MIDDVAEGLPSTCDGAYIIYTTDHAYKLYI
jgi:hypothetical protein